MSFLDAVPPLPLAPEDGSDSAFARTLTPERAEALLACSRGYPIFRFLGMSLDRIALDEADIGLTHRVEFTNPMAGLHGGLIATAIDTAIGWAMATTLKQGYVVATVAMDVKFFKPVMRGRITAAGRIIRKGRQVLHGEVAVTAEGGDLVAKGSCIYMPMRFEMPKKAA